MRLINVHTGQLEEFFGRHIPKYYILSHTWESDEISYQDYTWLSNYEVEVGDGIIDELPPKQRARVQARAEALRNRSGYKKIQSFSQLAHNSPRHEPGEQINFGRPSTCPIIPYPDGDIIDYPVVNVQYVWIDTCCINKESSAELSEAINSMYLWYENAEICVTFLSDVELAYEDLVLGKLGESSFPRSRWWTRGWTLQELIAPRAMLFYNRSWEYIIDRHSVENHIQERTGIPPDQFCDVTDDHPIAERMSWAANRETTRVEDRAYCLMGIFGVNMPLLYGEGDKAFYRLQREIASLSGDQSIFAWGYDKPLSDYKYLHSALDMFAQSPADFSTGGQVQRIEFNRMTIPFSSTNVGLQMLGTLVRPVPGEKGSQATYLALHSVGVRVNRLEKDILAVPVRGYKIDSLDLDDIAQDIVIFRAVGRPVRIPIAILTQQDRRVERRVIVERVGRMDSFGLSTDQPGGRELFDYLVVAVKEETGLDIHETWPHCLRHDINREGETRIYIRISNWHLSSAFLRFTQRSGNDERGQQFLVAFHLDHVTPNRRKLVKDVRVFRWDTFARLARSYDINSLAGLLFCSPQLTEADNWPSKYKASKKFRVDISIRDLDQPHCHNCFTADLRATNIDDECGGLSEIYP